MSRPPMTLLLATAFLALSCECDPARTTAGTDPVLFSSIAPGAVRGIDDQEDLPREPVAGGTWVQDVPGTATSLTMCPVPDGKGGTMWVMKHELTWNLFDIFIFRLDEKKGNGSPASDAVTRPTKPYIAVDRGFGHDGYPAISMSYKGAVQFAEWIRAKTGRNFRIPTVEEWRAIAASAGIPADAIDDHGWHRGNAEETTHPVGEKKADSLGLHDLYGNVAEWCTTTDEDGKPMGVVMGGGFESEPEGLNGTETVERTLMWNDSDPQFPKSVWWLADAAFVGIRLVCTEQTQDQQGDDESTKEKTNDDA
ncbi:MAG: formylglycine-generating enzyme family protein [Phycisphaerales bacterium]|nr:formylglycine-generating enzyme family protein [Phycisphaerales bacterium]